MKTTKDLMRRVHISEKAIAQLPEWARNGCRWQGGGERRTKPEEPGHD